MVIKKQLIPVQMGGGINTIVDDKQLQAGELLQLQNGQFSKTGQINKRFGYDLQSNTIQGGGTLSAGAQITTHLNELVAFDGNNIYSYLPSTSNWINRGTAISITSSDTNVIHNSASTQINADMAQAQGIQAFAWEDSRGGIRYSIKDAVSGTFIVSDVFFGSGQQPKCITFNNQIVIFFTDGGNTLYYSIINPLNPTVINPAVPVQTNGFAGLNGFPYDVSVINNYLYIVYLSGSVITGAITVFNMDINYNVITNVTVNSTIGQAINNGFHGAVNIVGDLFNNVWVIWANGVDIRAQCYPFGFFINGIFTTLLSNLAIEINDVRAISSIKFTTSNGTNVLLAVYEVHNAISYNEEVHATTITTTGVTNGVHLILSVGLASKCFNYNGNIYLNAAYQSALQATDFLFLIANSSGLLANPVIVAKFTPATSGGLITNAMCPEIIQTSAGNFVFANNSAGAILSQNNTLFTTYGIVASAIILTPSDNFECTTQDKTLLITGGILQAYDGSSCNELGFHLYPENITASQDISKPGNLSVGQYQYIVEFQWTDNNGNIYRSSPSVPVTVTTTNSNWINLAGPMLRLTQKPTAISIVIYRTLVNESTANGAVFYRVTSVTSPLENNVFSASWQYQDALSDSVINSNDYDYTTGGVLANIAPPANSIIATYNNRVFLSGMSDPLLMWYSQSVVDNSNSNTIPPQFCAQLNISLDPRGGAITALGVINQVLVVFKQSAIFAVQGNGPDASGLNSDYGDPTFVTSDAGCINASSVVIFPGGLIFQSAKGLYQLDQSLNLTYLGDKVANFNSYTITSATLHSNYNQVIFTTAQNTSLVYDYYHTQWSTWTNQPAVASTIYNSKLVYLTGSGQIFQQNITKFQDGSSPISLSFTLPNLAFAGIQGYQRVFRVFILGSFKGPHQLQVNVAYDYNAVYSQSDLITPSNNISYYDTWGSSISWGDDQFWGGLGYQIYEFRVDFRVQKCTAIRLQITDTQTLAINSNNAISYNEGYAISSIVFEVGALPGGNRLPKTNISGT